MPPKKCLLYSTSTCHLPPATNPDVSDYLGIDHQDRPSFHTMQIISCSQLSLRVWWVRF